jgi:NMD protein affecting ribosome stability and mRNA decay
MSRFACPRCGKEVTERFYGPCEDCRVQLTETMGAKPSAEVGEPTRYEPKMNVVRNFVATKDDLDDFEPDPGER